MGYKVFVSYKHSDSSVYPLNGGYFKTTARNYVNEIEQLLGIDNIYKGEHDDEDLSIFKDSTIESHLRDKIYDSSVTLVVISPSMKEPYKMESDQWIPWEVSYSLKEHTRRGRTTQTNAALAVVLPDINGSYAYYLEDKQCCAPGCRMHRTDTLFQILRDNMFNASTKNRMNCLQGSNVYTGEYSYIPSVKWVDFTHNVNGCLDRAVRIHENIDQYEIVKEIK